MVALTVAVKVFQFWLLMVKIEHLKAPSTRIPIFFNPQLFLCVFGFPATTRIGWTWKTNPQLFESALQSGNFLIRYESGIAWILNPDIFIFGRDVKKSSPVLYPEYPDTCGRDLRALPLVLSAWVICRERFRFRKLINPLSFYRTCLSVTRYN